MSVCVDTDRAGCLRTSKSTSGGCLVLWNHLVKGWAKTQALIAFSSAENELYAALKTSAEALGLISMAKDMGYKLTGRVWGDASAALGIFSVVDLVEHDAAVVGHRRPLFGDRDIAGREQQDGNQRTQ